MPFRLPLIAVLFCLAFAAAVARLVELQFYRSDELVEYRENRLRHMEQKAPRRGRILDSAGAVLAEDRPTHDLWIAPARREKVDGRMRIVSNLEPLTVDQLMSLAADPESESLERRLAVTALADSNPMVAELASRMRIPAAEIAAKILAAALSGRPASRDDLLYSRFAMEDIDFGLALEIRAARANPYDEGEWRAAEMKIGGKRFYPAGKVLGHITGYVGKLTPEDYVELRGRWDGDEKIPGKGFINKRDRLFFSILSKDPAHPVTDEELIVRLREVKRSGKMIKTQGYFLNETVGRGGLEQYYNQALRGRHTLQRLRLSRDEESRKRRFQPLGDVERAKNGVDVRLSLKLGIQQKAHEIMEKNIKDISKRPELVQSDWVQSGVAILMDPNNGRILAMVSIPSYDPNTLNRDFKELLKDPATPLLDRAIAGIYPPGSVVKPVVGLAAISENKVVPGERFVCDHILMLAGAKFTCLGRHGGMDLESALMHSCNIYFYHAGERLGGRLLYDWYTRMGIGHRTGIDLAGEAPGLLPRNAFTRRGWATGNTYHFAIGQGMAITPMQLAVAYSALANAKGGIARVVRPHFLIPPARPPETPEEAELAAEALRLDQPVAEISVDMESLAVVRQGMWEVVQGKPETGELGTGRLAAFPTPGGDFLVEIAGKTGTAEWTEVVNGRARKGISHVWFAGYAPFDRPQVVVVVMLPEAGGGGGGTCAPIAKELLRLWFNLPKRLEHQVYEEDALG